MTFECEINGTNEGSTLWKGTALQDVCMLQDIILLHREFAPGIIGVSECGGGTVAWRTLGVENNCYISQLNITYVANLIGKTIICAYNNLAQDIIISSRVITTTNMTCMLILFVSAVKFT